MTDERELLDQGRVIHTNERNGAPLMLIGEDIAVKLFPRRSPVVHCLRVAFKSTKAHKQWNAAQALMGIGLKTPEPISVNVFDNNGNFEAAYLYRYLESASPFNEALRVNGRSSLLGKLAKDVALMAQNGMLFIDFHLGNILVDEEHNLWWIDPEMTFSKAEIRQKFWSRMERMHLKCDPGVLSDAEWSDFVRNLNGQLPDELKKSSR